MQHLQPCTHEQCHSIKASPKINSLLKANQCIICMTKKSLLLHNIPMGEVHGPVPAKASLCLCFNTHQALWFLLFLRSIYHVWKLLLAAEGAKLVKKRVKSILLPPYPHYLPGHRRDLWWIQYPSTRERGRFGSGTVELELVGLMWLSWGYHPGAQAAQCCPCLVMLVTCTFRISLLTVLFNTHLSGGRLVPFSGPLFKIQHQHSSFVIILTSDKHLFMLVGKK